MRIPKTSLHIYLSFAAFGTNFLRISENKRVLRLGNLHTEGDLSNFLLPLHNIHKSLVQFPLPALNHQKVKQSRADSTFPHIDINTEYLSICQIRKKPSQLTAQHIPHRLISVIWMIQNNYLWFTHAPPFYPELQRWWRMGLIEINHFGNIQSKNWDFWCTWKRQVRWQLIPYWISMLIICIFLTALHSNMLNLLITKPYQNSKTKRNENKI